MSKLFKLDSAYDVKTTLEEAIQKYGDAKACVILVLQKDDTQAMMTSKISQYEKCFLKCFWDSWIAKWFDDSYSL